MLPKKWSNLERQRPQLRWVKWGEGLGALLVLGSLVGVGNWELGLAMMAGFGVWGYTILNK
jgi:hypothetical protein